MSKTNYNKLALLGYDFDDMEYVKEFDMPAEYANTKQLNDYMLDYEQTRAEDSYILEGIPADQAKSMAREARMKAEAEINELYKLHDL